MDSVANACPKCASALAAADINITEGVALCRACGVLSRLADVAAIAPPAALVGPAPRGCEVRDLGGEAVVSASLRSIPGFLGALFFCLFWNGIVSVFVAALASAIWSHLFGAPPSWFPAPTMNSQSMSVGTTVFMALFLTPFVLVGIGLIVAVLLSFSGSVEVSIRAERGTVATGIGALRWRKRFDASAVGRVYVGTAGWTKNEVPQQAVCIETPEKTVKFGSMLPEARRTWLSAALHALLVTAPRRA